MKIMKIQYLSLISLLFAINFKTIIAPKSCSHFEHQFRSQEIDKIGDRNAISIESNARMGLTTATASGPQADMMSIRLQDRSAPSGLVRAEHNSDLKLRESTQSLVIAVNDKKRSSVNEGLTEVQFKGHGQQKQPILVKNFFGETIKKPDKLKSEPDSMPGPKPEKIVTPKPGSNPGPEAQPLPPSSKPLSGKIDCVVLGRAGKCFPIFPFTNFFDCFLDGGVVGLDIVRCSWVKGCCVPNLFR